MRQTYHLTPAVAWAGRDPTAPIESTSLATEGFIHCTDGAEAMVATANRHYRETPGSFVVLTIDLDATGSPWRFDDQAGIYPHVYGSIAPAAVLAVQPIPRAADGTFLAFTGSGVPAGVKVETIYVVEATYGPAAAELRPFSRPEHLGHLADLIRAGDVIEAGGYLDFSSAILLVRADSEAAALEMFRDDVYIRTGVWTELRARAYGRVVAERD
jgi:uncharacterized protein (DUF952 family)/uncharacterized protein YciI